MFICKLDISEETVAVDTDSYRKQEVQLYPNPLTAGDVLHIQLPDLSAKSDLLLQVYDSSGKLVMHQKTDGHTLDTGLPLPVFSQGVFFVKISTEDGHYFGKVLVLD